MKEEYVETDAERTAQDTVSYPSPAVITSPLSSPASSAPRVTATSPAAVTGDLRPTIDGSNFGDHLRSLLYAEAGFHGPGPSGLLGVS